MPKCWVKHKFYLQKKSEIISGLETIKVEFLQGTFCPSAPSEDIHYCIEEKLITLIGETGKNCIQEE